jgi:hypothetical protein
VARRRALPADQLERLNERYRREHDAHVALAQARIAVGEAVDGLAAADDVLEQARRCEHGAYQQVVALVGAAAAAELSGGPPNGSANADDTTTTRTPARSPRHESSTPRSRPGPRAAAAPRSRSPKSPPSRASSTRGSGAPIYARSSEGGQVSVWSWHVVLAPGPDGRRRATGPSRRLIVPASLPRPLARDLGRRHDQDRPVGRLKDGVGDTAQAVAAPAASHFFRRRTTE